MGYGSSISKGTIVNIITGMTPIEPYDYHFYTIFGNNITNFSLELVNCIQSNSSNLSVSYIGYYFPDMSPLKEDVYMDTASLTCPYNSAVCIQNSFALECLEEYFWEFGRCFSICPQALIPDLYNNCQLKHFDSGTRNEDP